MAKHLTLAELDTIPYLNERGEVLDSKKIERAEQEDLEKYIPSYACVLELGGRYGMVSAVINHRLSDPTQHLVVEPDPNVQKALVANRESHHCNYKIWNGIISHKPMYFYSLGYGSFCSTIPNDHPVSTLSLEEIQEQFQIRDFTHLVADCEGGLLDFLQENMEFISKLEGIYFEQDDKHNYKLSYIPLILKLQEWGFVPIQSKYRQYWENPRLKNCRQEILKNQTDATNTS